MPVKTRAAVAFAPNEPLRVVEVDLADPGPGEVMVRIIATGLCHSDLNIIDGSVPYTFPIILGHEAIGEVVEVGAGVSDFAPGDRVIPYLIPDCGECAFCRSGRTNMCAQREIRRQSGRTPFSLDGRPVAHFLGLATFAETTVIAADQLVKVNRAARTDQACCIGCGVTTGLGAALRTADVKPGSSVAVFGCGGIGLSVIQGARMAGAAKIIAIDTNPAKAAIASKLGATEFINPRDGGDVVARIVELTGLGADYAFECAGIPALGEQALECTNPAWGVAVCVGIVPAGKTVSALPGMLLTGRRWTGSFMGGAKRQDVARYVDMFVAGAFSLDDLVSHRLPHAEINKGFDMMRSGEAVRTVLVYADA